MRALEFTSTGNVDDIDPFEFCKHRYMHALDAFTDSLGWSTQTSLQRSNPEIDKMLGRALMYAYETEEYDFRVCLVGYCVYAQRNRNI